MTTTTPTYEIPLKYQIKPQNPPLQHQIEIQKPNPAKFELIEQIIAKYPSPATNNSNDNPQ